MPLGTDVGLSTGHIVLDGDPAAPQKRGHSPQFLAHVCCGQTAGLIKMPLGMNVGVGPGDIMLDGNPAPLPKQGTALQFSAHVFCGQMARLIETPLGTEVGLGPGHIVLDGDTAPPKGAQPPIFSPYSIVAKQSPMSATAEHL